MFTSIVAIAAAAAGVAACSSFGSAADGGEGPSEATAPDAGGDHADTPEAACDPLASLNEDFTSGLGLLDTKVESKGGAVSTETGALVATVPLAGVAQAEARHTFGSSPRRSGRRASRSSSRISSTLRGASSSR